MELIVRVTREQMVALAPCAEGLDLFDLLVPSGIFVSVDLAEVEDLTGRIPKNFSAWLGGILVSGDGSGYGDGSGDGYGYGYGDGAGSGDGWYGSGYGDGYGDGAGDA